MMDFAALSATSMLSIIAIVISVISAAGAVGAVVVSRQALDYQKKRDAQQKTPVVGIEVKHTTAHYKEMGLGEPTRLRYVLTIRVFNSGETEETLASLVIESLDKKELIDLTEGLGEQRTLPVHGDRSASVVVSEDPDLSQGFIAVARLARGSEIASVAEKLNEECLQKVRDFKPVDGSMRR
jgi:hypothetical protein